MEYKPTIGLEIHVELKTRTKMFCSCLNDPDEKHPNINICPICMGHPGTLPVINKQAIKSVLAVGKALGGKIPEYSQFDRKNYFYPDLPKGYQISQYKNPLVLGGELNGVKITRIHLEEDTGGLVHKKDKSLINFNRAGVPLMELVTEPVINSSKEAKNFCEEFHLILRYLGVSSANMEKGEMRCEVNISLNMGIKVEIKNLNSFRAVERAIDYEIERQKELLSKGEKVVQETRGWNEEKETTFSQRKKEESHDYRYFPEPDLPALTWEFNSQAGVELPELPQEKRKRFKEQFNLKNEQTETLINDRKLGKFFEEIISELKTSDVDKKTSDVVNLAVNYLTSDLLGLMKEKMLSFEEILITPENFAELMNMISRKEITSRVAKDVLRIMTEKGGDPSLIIEERGLEQISDESSINNLIKQIVEENPNVIEEYKRGKETALQFLIGQAMKKTKGIVNPEVFKKSLLMFIKV